MGARELQDYRYEMYPIISHEYRTVDAFKLKEGRYILTSQGIEDLLPFGCLEMEFSIKMFFDSVELV